MTDKKQKTASEPSLAPDRPIPGRSSQRGKGNKREKYHDKMIGLGFSKIYPYVHRDDKAKVLDYIAKLREKRLA